MSSAYDMIPVLSCENIDKEYVTERTWNGKTKKIFKAVENISLYINEGETLGIVGESGSGKSTIGDILGNLKSQTRGKVFYRGQDVAEMDEESFKKYRKNVQFIFQDPKGSMNPYYSVLEIIGEPLKMLGITDDEEVIERKVLGIMDKVGLSKSVLYKRPDSLSGGQCQRVAIARALVVRPEIIICDEPVSALDVSVQAQILNLLKDLQEEMDIAYLFISHDIGVVNYISNRIVVMNKGHIVEMGRANVVFANPKDEYTRKLVECSFVN